MFQLFFINWD